MILLGFLSIAVSGCCGPNSLTHPLDGACTSGSGAILKIPNNPESLPVKAALKGNQAFFITLSTAATLMGLLFFVRLDADVNWDGVVFINAAQKFATAGFSEGFSAWPKFPAYPLLIVFIHYFVPDWVAAGRLISLVSSIATVAGLFRLAEDRFGTETALLSSLVFAFLPETLLQSNSVYRDPVFLAAFIWSVYFFQKSITSEQPSTLAAAILLLLLSSMFRAEGLCVLVVYMVTLLLGARRNVVIRKKNIRFVLICVSALCLFGFGLFFFLYYTDKSTYITQLKTTFSGYTSARLTENLYRLSDQLQAINDATPSSDVGVHFGGLAKRMIPLIFGLGLLNVFASTMLFANTALAVIGLINTKWNLPKKFIIACAIAYFCILYLYLVSYDLMLNRWLLPVAVLICPWVGAGICSVFQPIQKLRYARFLCAAIIILIAINSAIEFNKFFRANDNLASTAGSWISKQGRFNGSNTVFNDPVVAFYSEISLSFIGQGSTHFYFKNDDKTFSEIEEYAIENKLEFIVIYIKKSRIDQMARFRTFLNIKEFDMGNKMVLIFCSTSKCQQEIPHGGKST